MSDDAKTFMPLFVVIVGAAILLLITSVAVEAGDWYNQGIVDGITRQVVLEEIYEDVYTFRRPVDGRMVIFDERIDKSNYFDMNH